MKINCCCFDIRESRILFEFQTTIWQNVLNLCSETLMMNVAWPHLQPTMYRFDEYNIRHLVYNLTMMTIWWSRWFASFDFNHAREPQQWSSYMYSIMHDYYGTMNWMTIQWIIIESIIYCCCLFVYLIYLWIYNMCLHTSMWFGRTMWFHQFRYRLPLHGSSPMSRIWL